jgi:hypothetical protein
MRCTILLAAVGLAVAGCTRAPVPPSPTVGPTPVPLINVDDMMGLYPQQTVFVATPDHVSAVTLLNHFTRYRIGTSGMAQLSADGSGQRLYLLDADGAGSHRLRAFDVSSGSERAARGAILDVVEARHGLSAATPGRVLVLKSDARRAWVDAYEGGALRSLGPVMEKPGCGDRLLTSGSRVAIVCSATGSIAVTDLGGNPMAIDGAPSNLVGAAMADDGTLYVVTADQHLATGATQLLNVAWPSEWSGTVQADGLALTQGGATVVIAERDDDSAWLRVLATNNTTKRKSVRLAGAPQGGVLAMWPFAYYAVDGSIRHVDLATGLLETMTEVGAGAAPGAVVNG